jgi:hypothetical protein
VKLVTMAAGTLALGCAAGGCGSRNNYWNQPVAATGYGLANGVALVDDNTHRVVIVSANADQSVSEEQVTVGHNVATVATSADGYKLYVMSTGDWPPQSASDQVPTLTVVDVSTRGSPAVKSYPMQQPLSNLVIDPLGQWAVAYAASNQSTSLVENPNEIVLFNPNLAYTPASADAGAGPDGGGPLQNPVTLDIQSFGGTPQQLTFTPPLFLPDGTDASGDEVGATTRLLLIESTVDLTMLDMSYAFNPPATRRPEITVQLTDGTSTQHETPAGVVVDDGDPTDPNDARIALWTSTDTNVFVFKLIASQPGTPNPFTPSINSAPVGPACTTPGPPCQIPSAVAFVHTSPLPANDYGLQVLALVPGLESAVFIDDSDETTTVPLPAQYTNLSLVTNVVGPSGGAAGPDVALLWQQSSPGSGDGVASGVAFWGLQDTSTEGIDVVSVTEPIQAVLDVGGSTTSTNPQLKVLQLEDSGIYVLDLIARTASPLDTMGAPSLTISADGKRMWAFAQGGTKLAEIQLPGLNLVPLTTTLAIGSVYDVTIASADAGANAQSALIATHPAGAWGATVFNASDPTIATASNATALLLEGAP